MTRGMTVVSLHLRRGLLGQDDTVICCITIVDAASHILAHGASERMAWSSQKHTRHALLSPDVIPSRSSDKRLA